ncbi:golgin subfamily A member 4 isoform X2 [Sitodiplosis mosellana]|uniref:golgin subfamily A member 4 isoform X2 n=1 Tax=Sitodiplosis mosellana TaxID=263140 RepID=UPI002443C8A8|nr:golgin subfamily A member 4 isoform X2 [Sitodiplosis mosellana]
MFKKLKDKIAEEVKSSPSRIQQLAQVAQAAVSSASSTTSESVPSNDNFFSIAEEDTPQNSPHRSNLGNTATGAKAIISPNSISNFQNQHTPNNGNVPTVRVRKLSNSSMASDVSFRLPSLDTSPSAYNIQSDIDASASEFEDSASTFGYEAQLDVISKEKLYDAYKKSLERYQKYRSRYSELVRRYRDLERDNNKARSVLVETQDKALRRISELREQCSLEQQAKAHLEAALRMEMDEQQCIIDTLKTKLSLNGEENIEEIVENGTNNLISLNDVNGIQQQLISDNSSDNLINITDSADEFSDLTEKENQIIAGASIMINDSNDKIKTLETQLNAMKKQISDEQNKSAELSRLLESSQKQVKDLIIREEENTILLAQNKLAIHSELENKEKEMKSLKIDAKQSASEKECLNEIVTELRELNSKANVSIKELSEAKRSLEEKVDEMKKNAIIAESDNKELRAKVIVLDSEKQSILAKNALELEKFKARYDSLMIKNEQLEEITRTRVMECHEKLETELKTTKELNTKLSQQLSEEQKRSKEMLSENRDSIKLMSSDFDSVKADKMKLESRFKQLFEERTSVTAELDATKLQLTQANGLVEELKTQVDVLMKKQDTTKEIVAKLERELTNKNDFNAEKDDSKSEVIGLTSKIDSLKSEKKDLEKTLEKTLREKSELQNQVTNILQEIGRLEEQLKDVKQKYSELEQEKRMLQEESAQQHHVDSKADDDRIEALTTKIKEFEIKLKTIECENSQLAEKNCLLEESNNRLQSSQKDFEGALKKENVNNQRLNDRISELTLEIDSLKEENSRLQDKLKKSLDDYAELFNTKEQMDLEHRSLLDQLECKEKEKLCVVDQQSSLEQQKSELTKTCGQLRIDLETLRSENSLLQTSKIELDSKCAQLNARINDVTIENDKFQHQNKSLQREICILKERSFEVGELLNKSNNEKEDLKATVKRLANIESSSERYDQIKIENEYLNKLTKQLEGDVKTKYDEVVTINNELVELKGKLKSQQCELYVLTEEKRDYTKVFDEKDKEIEQLKSICQRSQVFSEELQNEIKQLTEQLNTLKFMNDELQTTKDSLESKYEKVYTEFEASKQSLDQHIYENKKQHEENKTIKSGLDEKVMELSQAEEKLVNSQKELESCRAIISDLNADLNDQSEKLETNKNETVALQDKINELEAKINSTPSIDDAEETKRSYENLKYELAETKRKNQRDIAELLHEIDELKENIEAYREKQSELKATNEILTHQLTEVIEQQQQQDKSMAKFDEYQAESAFSPENNSNEESSDSDTELSTVERLKKEKIDLEQQMNKILSEVQDVSNRNLFLEQQCENYLILEQHNERLKLQNNKLSRQLDETLVSMHHSDDISANTEFEYLKNIMFQYLTNNINSNGTTLIKVIAAVLKFTPQQTQVVLEKEAHRKTLVNYSIQLNVHLLYY